METINRNKIQNYHLKRIAYLYIRQSTLKQVLNNQESTKRQYALRENLLALGWGARNLITIDEDQGKTGSDSTCRNGFQKLFTEVSRGNVGIVASLEVSRFARNNADWHRLLEICALSQTLILDEEGIYNPANFNDRLLLGLKGTMSEAELHILRARLQGGIINKAKRGELKISLPIGFVYDVLGNVQLDPDQHIQEIIRFFFMTFNRVGSAYGIVKVFSEENLKMPQRVRTGMHKGEVVEIPLTPSRALHILHNPRYAGAFVYGRRRLNHIVGKAKIENLPREEWTSLIFNKHDSYISWEEYENNQKTLLENAHSCNIYKSKGLVRKGPALLQGIALCGRCGSRMAIRYNSKNGKLTPAYICRKEYEKSGAQSCQSIAGSNIDKAIVDKLIEIVTPQNLELALTIQEELESRKNEMESVWQKQVEKDQYEANLARRRYMQTDPDNRLVAATLEADWNNKLKILEESQNELEQQKKRYSQILNDTVRKEILSLSSDFASLWNNKETSDIDHKKIIRLLIEDVTLTKGSNIIVQIRYRGGKLETMELSKTLHRCEQIRTSSEVLKNIDSLLDHHIPEKIATILNKKGHKTGTGLTFTKKRVLDIIRKNKIKTRYERLRDKGFLTASEVMEKAGVCKMTIRRWCRVGLMIRHFYTKTQYLYSQEDLPKKAPGVKLSNRKTSY